MLVCMGSLQVGQCFFHKLLFHMTHKPEIQILDTLEGDTFLFYNLASLIIKPILIRVYPR